MGYIKDFAQQWQKWWQRQRRSSDFFFETDELKNGHNSNSINLRIIPLASGLKLCLDMPRKYSKFGTDIFITFSVTG